jgi:hypothetical protein
MGDTWRAHWLHPLMGTTTRDTLTPQAYMAALQHVAVTLDGDPAWQSWWEASGVPECQLGIVAEGRPDHLRPSADIRKAGDKVRANFTCTLPDDGGELFPLAVDEVTAMFAVIREAIGLAALPALPTLPELPADAGEVAVTTKSLPPVPRDVKQQGYLTLAQIQEFFA